MNPQIDCFVAGSDPQTLGATVQHLRDNSSVQQIRVVGDPPSLPDGCTSLPGCSFSESASLRQMAQCTTAPYTLYFTGSGQLRFTPGGLERMVQIADDTHATMLYADFAREVDTQRTLCPVIDYQSGSLRDDFEFGPVILWRTDALRRAAEQMNTDYHYAGLYELRLRLSQNGLPVHNENLYTELLATQNAEGSLFSYVDPKNRAVQIEMEQVCTEHLRQTGGYLAPRFHEPDFAASTFEYEASVIIPVRNRVRTIADAINSVLGQQTSFRFNLIVIDNHSTDGTTETIDRYADDPRVIHLIPQQNDLGIGGCWNAGVAHPLCGRFAVQLDSDDVYASNDVLQRIVDAFYDQRCAMLVGSYQLTDIELNTIPPGVIDHREWTPDNGRNNALRINGLGAPRAFYTPLLREIRLPNTSYGEDYALGLRFSREYRIGRLYDVLYLCRRWEDNSDAAPDRAKTNRNNLYKDRIRTWELEARIRINNYIKQ